MTFVFTSISEFDNSGLRIDDAILPQNSEILSMSICMHVFKCFVPLYFQCEQVEGEMNKVIHQHRTALHSCLDILHTYGTIVSQVRSNSKNETSRTWYSYFTNEMTGLKLILFLFLWLFCFSFLLRIWCRQEVSRFRNGYRCSSVTLLLNSTYLLLEYSIKICIRVLQ